MGLPLADDRARRKEQWNTHVEVVGDLQADPGSIPGISTDSKKPLRHMPERFFRVYRTRYMVIAASSIVAAAPSPTPKTTYAKPSARYFAKVRTIPCP